MSDINVIALGREAGRLLSDPAHKAAMAKAEAYIVREWAATNASEVSRREELHAELRALKRLQGALQAIHTDGTAQSDSSPRRIST
jgi:hypothetical protein